MNYDNIHPSLVGWMKCLILQEGGTLPMMMPKLTLIAVAVRGAFGAIQVQP